MLKKLIFIPIILFLLFNFGFACKFVKREYKDIFLNSSVSIIAQVKKSEDSVVEWKNYKTLNGTAPEYLKTRLKSTSCDFSINDFEIGSFWVIFGEYSNGYLYFSLPSNSREFQTLSEAEDFFKREVENNLNLEDLKQIDKKNEITSQPVYQKAQVNSEKPFVYGPQGPPPTKAMVKKIVENAQNTREGDANNESGSFWSNLFSNDSKKVDIKNSKNYDELGFWEWLWLKIKNFFSF